MKKTIKFFLIKFLQIIPVNLIINTLKKCIYYKLLSTNVKVGLKQLLELDNFIYLLTGRYSVEYGHGVHVKKRFTKYVDFFVENVKRVGGPCIDIGCGDGEVAINIAKQDIRVTAVDISKEQIDMAKRKYVNKNLEFVNCDILKYDAKGQKFKTVILSNVLEHIKDRIIFLRKIKKQFSLKYFLIRVPVFDRDWRVPLKKELGIDYRLDSTHFIEYTEETLLKELTKSSIKIINCKRIWGEFWLLGKSAR